MKGFFQLAEPKDLLTKLERDFERISAEMSNPYPAFDFFVTAEHLLDWLYPGAKGKAQRTKCRKAEPLLQIVSHIASGAKHMTPEAEHHKAVDHTEAVGAPYGVGPFGAGSYGLGPLVVYLDGPTSSKLGYSSINTLGLAHRVLEYWRANIPR